ncbi:hypothetical protein WICPIJ_009879 [Wickerhamomyces pijperi]|uniref:Protein SYS1 n=1 Tax=Wickerhamomyces pijperi TaxID=599730 RepID=A0A9P8TCH7_WICPI|nr:hypothetical protein WICPIJ_009879 [Wickerhamomyces pijperi]
MSLRNIGAALNRIHYSSLLPNSTTSHIFGTGDSYAPRTIVIQIFTIQIFYYLTALVIQYAVSILLGLEYTLAWTFSWRLITLDNSLGWILIIIWLIDSFISVLFLTLVVGRSKLAWDFALTIHFVNLLVVWFYEGTFPWDFYWWVLQVISTFVLVSLGTWGAQWRELRDTFFEGIVDVELGNLSAPTTVPDTVQDPSKAGPNVSKSNQ